MGIQMLEPIVVSHETATKIALCTWENDANIVVENTRPWMICKKPFGRVLTNMDGSHARVAGLYTTQTWEGEI